MEKLKLLPRPKYKKPSISPKTLYNSAAFAAGLLLSGTSLLGIHLPAAVCLISTCGNSLPALCSYLGAAAGCLLLHNVDSSLLTLTAGFLTLVTCWALAEFPFSQKRWFSVLTATIAGSTVALLLLLSSPITPKAILAFLLQTATLPLGAWAARAVLDRPAGTPICAAIFALVSGSGTLLLPGDLPLGGILAAAAVFSLSGTSLSLPAAVLAGLALDWSWQGSTSCVAILTTAALAANYIPLKKRWLGLLPFLTTASAVLLLTGGEGGELLPAIAIGCGVSLLLPPVNVEEPALSPADAVRRRLRSAATALEDICQQLEQIPAPDKAAEISDIYDKATARVCATCASASACWRHSGDATQKILWDASDAIFARGSAKPEDFPPEFRDNCRHFSRLTLAITSAIEENIQRKRTEHYRRELRSVMSSQYRVLADFLSREVLPIRTPKEPLFQADTACLARGRKNAAVSGDRCTSFRVGDRQFLLLCDGMGTGPSAAADSCRAMQLMTRLLKAGMSPDGALETLSALAILGEDGGFCALDLAWVSLKTGEGILYKWGGGPSYIKSGSKVKKIGTAILPPGLGVGGAYQARQYGLSLERGEVLILTSDGVDGEDAQRLLQAAAGLRAKDLAAMILQSGISEGEDDASAAVLMLHSTSQQ